MTRAVRWTSWLPPFIVGACAAVAGELAIGLLLYGTGMGLTYYASIYYSMAVGHAAVEAGGNFEALIGVGYCVGPFLGVAGHAASATHAEAATVGFTWLALALAAPFVVRPYLAARRARRARAG